MKVNELPDSRLLLWGRRKRTSVGKLELAFCANCGKQEGAFTPGLPFTFYLCDGCADKHGPPPGCIEVSQ